MTGTEWRPYLVLIVLHVAALAPRTARADVTFTGAETQCTNGASYCSPDCLSRFDKSTCDFITASKSYYAKSPAEPILRGETEEFDACQDHRTSDYADQICCPLTDPVGYRCAMKNFTCFVDDELLPADAQNAKKTKTWRDLKVELGVGGPKRAHPVYIENGNWKSFQIIPTLAWLLTSEMMGYDSVPVYGKGGTYWYPRVAMGNTTLNFELWDGTKEADLLHFAGASNLIDHGMSGVPSETGLYMPAYANSIPGLQNTILQHYLTLRSNPSVLSAFVSDGSANASSCEQMLPGGKLPAGAATCDEAFANDPTLDFYCPSTCELTSENRVTACYPWPATDEDVANNGGKCPACCTNGKWYSRTCRDRMVQTGAHTSAAAGCIEVLMPTTNEFHMLAIANNLQLPFVYSFYDGYPLVREEVKRRTRLKQLFLFYWYSPEALFSFRTPDIPDIEPVSFVPLILPAQTKECNMAGASRNPDLAGNALVCGMSGVLLGKAMNKWYATGTGVDGTDLNFFWRAWGLSASEYNDLFAAETAAVARGNGDGMLQGVCDWAKKNVLSWRHWIKNTPPPDANTAVVRLTMYDDRSSGMGFSDPFNTKWSDQRLAPRHDDGQQYGVLGSLLTATALRMSETSGGSSTPAATTATVTGGSSGSQTFDFKLDLVQQPPRERGARSTFLSGTKQGPTLNERPSWRYSAPLWSAADMCEELLQTGNGQGRADLRALVVPLEPPLSKGYHPCWDPQLRRVRLYSPKLAIMIRDEEGGMSVYVAAAIALFSASTLQGLSVLFLMAALSATMIWFTERNQKGIFREANKYPVPLLAGYGDAFYWSITTATSTGYGDKVPKSPIGKVWAMFWMLIGILLFALVGGSLTTDIIEYTADHTVYDLGKVRAASKLAAVGGTYFGTRQLLLTRTPTTSFEACQAHTCITTLQNRSVDAVIGEYGTLLLHRTLLEDTPSSPQCSGSSTAQQCELERWARTQAGEPNAKVYVTGDSYTSESMYSFYVVYRPSHFTHGTDPKYEFGAKLKAVVEEIRDGSATGQAETFNFPFEARGYKSEVETVDAAIPLGSSVLALLLGFVASQCIGARGRRNRSQMPSCPRWKDLCGGDYVVDGIDAAADSSASVPRPIRYLSRGRHRATVGNNAQCTNQKANVIAHDARERDVFRETLGDRKIPATAKLADEALAVTAVEEKAGRGETVVV